MVECHLLVKLVKQFLDPVLHNWCNKDYGMYYPICGMVHIKESLQLIGSRFPTLGID